MNRQEFAVRISSGLAGWFQQLAAQGLEEQVGEDAARVELVRMISAQRAYVPDTSQRPTNWPADTKKRIDIAVLGRRTNAIGWYGAIELKWPVTEMDVKQVRHAIVEDAVRVAFAKTANLCANFLIVGGTKKALSKLFDKEHLTAKQSEQQRRHFNALFRRVESQPNGFLSNILLNKHFPDFGDRVPQLTFGGWSRRIRTDLIAVAPSTIGTDITGFVFVWQCKR